MTATHTYANPGTYTASLTIKDGAGNRDTSRITMTVQAVIPEVPSLMLSLLIVFAIASVLAFRKPRRSLC